ncbi:MAG: hypothetical protein E7665_09605 [Ruminococcaceae bacterium]|nr:hypothetical protein [Oscillospiraceae bacterium]
MADSERGVLFDDLGTFPIFFSGKIIYNRPEKRIFMGYVYDENKQKYESFYDKFCGKLYISEGDGTEERLLCDISGTGYVLQVASEIHGEKNGIGDYIVLKVEHYITTDEEKKYIEKMEDAFLAVNIVTGEYTFIEAM